MTIWIVYDIFLIDRNLIVQGPRSGFSSGGGGGGLTRMRKREATRGVRGHAPPGKFEILFF